MAYTTLYRKYRPTRFEEVKGQDPIVTTLKNQINAGRISHAYLFCGTRGTGKTTVAKIFAAAVNCAHPADGSPCGECASCRDIASGSSMNVIEIDAASNNGVENIRQIREEVSYPPTEGRYKVYIIDEVHMLSTGAFNALLKTLEEPPPYVIFILATTDVHKIPVTILSRCQRYDFRRISIETIAERLKDLLAREGVQAEDRAIRYVARAADGSMRDALSLMDQCIAFHLGKELTLDRVLEVLGAADTDVFSHLLRAVLDRDVAAAIQITEDMIVQGREPAQFVNDFTWYLRDLLLLKASENMEDVLDMSSENLAQLKEEAERVSEETVMRYIRVLSELSGQMRFEAQKRVLLEIALIRLCRPEMETTPDALSDRVACLEKMMENGIPAAAPQQSAAGRTEQPAARRTEQPAGPGCSEPEMPEAISEDLAAVQKKWKTIVQGMEAPLCFYLEKGLPTPGDGNLLILVIDDEKTYGYLKSEGREQRIAQFISENVGRRIDVAVRRNETGRPAGEVYPDLRRVDLSRINMPVDVDDD